MQAAPDKTESSAPVEKEIVAEAPAPATGGEDIGAPLSGNIWRVMVEPNQKIAEGDVLVVLEAMKMETEIKAARDGVVTGINVKEGDSVSVGQSLLTLA